MRILLSLLLLGGCASVVEHDAGTDAVIVPTRCTSDTHCDSGSYCDVPSGECTTECRTGPAIGLDVSLVEVALDVTLAGVPLASSAPSPGAQLTFVPEPRFSAGSKVDLFPEDGGPLSINLAVGSFDVWLSYLGTSPGAGWPVGARARVGRVEVREDTERLAIDIPTTSVTFRFTLDGEPLPSVPFVNAPEVELFPYQRTSFPLVISEITVALVPGEPVDIRYVQNGGSPAEWPLSGELMTGINLAPVIDVDIPRHRLNVTVNRSDDPSPEPAPDGVILSLKSRSAERPIRDGRLPPLSGGTTEVWVLPGEYTLQSVGGPADWPQGRAALADLDIAADHTETLVAEPVLITLYGSIQNDHATTCESVGGIWAAGVRLDMRPQRVETQVDVLVFRGAYPVEYQAPSDIRCTQDLAWPGHDAELTPITVTGPGEVRVGVPTVRLDLELTVDGQAPRGYTIDGPLIVASPRISVYSATDYTQVELYSRDALDGRTRNPIDAGITLVPGVVSLGYTRGREGTLEQWPLGGQPLADDVDVSEDMALSFDLRTTNVHIDLALQGGSMPAAELAVESWGGGGWPAGIIMRAQEAGGPIFRVWPWSEAGTFEHFDAPAILGRYDVFFGLVGGWTFDGSGPLPPPDQSLGCWIITP